MAWSDEPTEAQLNAIFRWLNWETPLPTDKARRAADWLRDNATRRDVSEEMQRMKKLKDRKNLSIDTCFEGEIWENFDK